jgi:hypothetical protein
MTTASALRSYSANSRENLNSNGTSLTVAGRIESIRDFFITQKRSLVTIESIATPTTLSSTCPVGANQELTADATAHR